MLVVLAILFVGILPLLVVPYFISNPNYGETIDIYMGKGGYQYYSPKFKESYDLIYNREVKWRAEVREGVYTGWYIALFVSVILYIISKIISLGDAIRKEKGTRITFSGIFFGVGLFLFCWLLKTNWVGYGWWGWWNFLDLFILSFFIMSIGLWYVLSSINRKISYGLLGISGIVSPLFLVYIMYLVTKFNHISGMIGLSTIIGFFGLCIAIFGIFMDDDSSVVEGEDGGILKILVAIWFFSMMAGFYAPGMVVS
jgi:hypothetical protein